MFARLFPFSASPLPLPPLLLPLLLLLLVSHSGLQRPVVAAKEAVFTSSLLREHNGSAITSSIWCPVNPEVEQWKALALVFVDFIASQWDKHSQPVKDILDPFSSFSTSPRIHTQQHTEFFSLTLCARPTPTSFCRNQAFKSSILLVLSLLEHHIQGRDTHTISHFLHTHNVILKKIGWGDHASQIASVLHLAPCV